MHGETVKFIMDVIYKYSFNSGNECKVQFWSTGKPR